MPNNIIHIITAVFEVIKNGIEEDDKFRVKNVQRRIAYPSKNQDIDDSFIKDFLGNVKIYTKIFTKFQMLIIQYQDEKYLLFAQNSIVEELNIDGISKIQDKNLYIAAGVTAIVGNVLTLKKSVTSLELIDKCLGYEPSPCETFVPFEWDYILEFFNEFTLYKVNEEIMPLDSQYSLQRLYAEIILTQDCTLCSGVSHNLLQLCTLDSVKLVIQHIIYVVESNSPQFAYLLLYQCLEFLFVINFANEIHTEYSRYSISMDLVTDLILKYKFHKREIEHLTKLLDNHVKKNQMSLLLSTKLNKTSDEVSKKLAEHVYNHRCNIAHLSYGTGIRNAIDWKLELDVLSTIVLHVYTSINSIISSLITSEKIEFRYIASK